MIITERWTTRHLLCRPRTVHSSVIDFLWWAHTASYSSVCSISKCGDLGPVLSLFLWCQSNPPRSQLCYATVAQCHCDAEIADSRAPRPPSHFSCEVIRRSAVTDRARMNTGTLKSILTNCVVCVTFCSQLWKIKILSVKSCTDLTKETKVIKVHFHSLSLSVWSLWDRDKLSYFPKTLKSWTKKYLKSKTWKGNHKDSSGGLNRNCKNGRRWFSSNSQFLHGARHSSSLSRPFSGPNSL